MKYRLPILAFLIVASLAFISCGDKPAANDPAVAAGILSQAAMAGSASPAARLLEARTVGVSMNASVAASAYASSFSGATATKFSITFTNQAVVYEGETYNLNGTLAYALSTDISSLPALKFSALVYAKGFTISGPKYEGNFDADFMEDISVNGNAMSCKITGKVGGVSLTTTVAASYGSKL